MSGPVDIMDHAVERSRDVLVTGMGFCLPGDQRPVFTAEDVWQIAAYGRSCLSRDGIYHGSVNLSDADFRERLPDFPGVFAQHFTDAHRFGWCRWWRPLWTPDWIHEPVISPRPRSLPAGPASMPMSRATSRSFAPTRSTPPRKRRWICISPVSRPSHRPTSPWSRPR